VETVDNLVQTLWISGPKVVDKCADNSPVVTESSPKYLILLIYPQVLGLIHSLSTGWLKPPF